MGVFKLAVSCTKLPLLSTGAQEHQSGYFAFRCRVVAEGDVWIISAAVDYRAAYYTFTIAKERISVETSITSPSSET
jgi:hypothetical protein